MSWISVATGAVLACAGAYVLGSHVLPAYEEHRALRLVSYFYIQLCETTLLYCQSFPTTSDHGEALLKTCLTQMHPGNDAKLCGVTLTEFSKDGATHLGNLFVREGCIRVTQRFRSPPDML